MLEILDAAAVHRWCGGGLALLRAHQHEIDLLNVYPVPDGDTGTNLVLTLTSAQEALDGVATPAGVTSSDDGEAGLTPLGRAMRRMARGALLGARGNSGVIVSQILRGMADTFAGSVAVRGNELARALRRATEAAYAAVARPVEGTVLSVVAAAADGADKIRSDDLMVVARAAAAAAAEALARTPQQLEVLARAGVVDAGGRGLVLLLEALVEALLTIAPPTLVKQIQAADRRPANEPDPGATDLGQSSPPGGHNLTKIKNGPARGHAELGYEVQYLVDAGAEAVTTLRATLGELGDSLVVVGTGEGETPTWNVHVHVRVDNVGPAIEAGVVAGRPWRIAVTRLEDRRSGAAQPEHRADPVEADQQSGLATPPFRRRVDDLRQEEAATRGAVVVAAGDGLTALFAAEGATVVGRNPSIAEMLDAIRATGARLVVLLPNDANTLTVAIAAAREAATAGLRASVVPTRSPVQALAALAVRDPGRDFADDVIAMAEAAGACRYGEVFTTSREALTVAGRCRPGDLLGLVDGEVHIIGADLEKVCRALLDRMLGGGGELATLVLGADAPSGLSDALRGHVQQVWPFVELQCYSGGQPRYHLLVGVE